MLNEMNQLSYDGTDDNLTSLPEDEITSVYGRTKQLADSMKALVMKGVTYSCTFVKFNTKKHIITTDQVSKVGWCES